MRWPEPDRAWVLLGLALAAGALAAWSAHRHLQDRLAQIDAQARVPTVRRLVAAHDLPAGTRLALAHLAVRDIPGQYAAADSFAPERVTEIEGAELARPLGGGDPILPAYLARPAGQSLSQRLAPGRRAITIPVDEISSLSGMLQPGDLIDLYVSFEHRRRRVTAPLLQGVRVLATGPRMSAGPGAAQDAGQGAGQGYSSVTLDTSAQDAVKLVAARQSGTVTAMLRHPSDAHSAGTAARGDVAALLGMEQKARRREPTVPVIYGDRPPARIPDLAGEPAQPEPAALVPVPPAQALALAWQRWLQAEGAGLTDEGAP